MMPHSASPASCPRRARERAMLRCLVRGIPGDQMAGMVSTVEGPWYGGGCFTERRNYGGVGLLRPHLKCHACDKTNGFAQKIHIISMIFILICHAFCSVRLVFVLIHLIAKPDTPLRCQQRWYSVWCFYLSISGYGGYR